ncbi:MAG: polysaccharide deacetylase family protein [Oscillospiraceae bacterium]|nr:polysaccharide deacetylase family protein [Oscillospiraceae bacterium]
MKKRGIALLLALVLMLRILPVQAQAASALAAITFDDGPSKYTSGLLDELDKRDVKVTFFMQGCNAEKYPSVVKRAYEAGHQIASHTYNHPQLTKLSDKEIQNQLSTTDSILNNAIGTNNSYMLRPPYGSTNERVLPAIGRPAIIWSVDTLDWKSRNADAVYQHIVNDTKDGSIVLLHDLYATSVSGALRGIDTLLSQGYELVTVEELLRRRGSDAVSGKKYFSASGKTTLPGISQPAITPAETEDGYLVSLSADEGTAIYYTTDGTAPTSQSTLYTGPFRLEGGADVKAFAAYTLNGGRSRVSEATLELPRAEKPVITLTEDTAVMTSGGEIYYTLDGTVPTAAAARYSGPVPVTAGTFIQAIAVQPGCRDSQASSLLYSGLGNIFSDIRPTNWYYHAVDSVVFQGLMTAANQTFSPEGTVRRRDLVTVLYRQAGQPEPLDTYIFSDVTGSDSAYAAIMWAAEQNILSGFEDGTIRPDAAVTREQLAVILYRMRPEPPEVDPAALYSFEDWESIQDYARDAVAWTVSQGILSGVSDTLLSPDSTVTRAQLASIVLRCQAF